jgi:hypothetical protein
VLKAAGATKICFWRGDAAAGPNEYVDWFVEVSYLRRDEDAERLREGLRRAGLPA